MGSLVITIMLGVIVLILLSSYISCIIQEKKERKRQKEETAKKALATPIADEKPKKTVKKSTVKK